MSSMYPTAGYLLRAGHLICSVRFYSMQELLLSVDRVDVDWTVRLHKTPWLKETSAAIEAHLAQRIVIARQGDVWRSSRR